VEIVVFTVAVAILGVISNFFGADSRELSPVRQNDIERWSR
jgi:hypothetical protein